MPSRKDLGDQKEKGRMNREEAGRKGGETTAARRTPEEKSEIGRKGGESRSSKQLLTLF